MTLKTVAGATLLSILIAGAASAAGSLSGSMTSGWKVVGTAFNPEGLLVITLQKDSDVAMCQIKKPSNDDDAVYTKRCWIIK